MATKKSSLENMGMSIQSFYKGKKIFITGHTGFKGAWLAFWLVELGAEVFGYALEPEYESSLFELLELKNKIHHHIGDVRDYESIANAMWGVDYVFHAAALKQVPSCEFFPLEATKTNVFGTNT